MIDETDLIKRLDEEWRSPSEIRHSLKVRGRSPEIAETLKKLADSGKIDRIIRRTPVIKSNGANLTIKLYRRLSV